MVHGENPGAGFEQVLWHRFAHDAQPYEVNGSIWSLLSVLLFG